MDKQNHIYVRRYTKNIETSVSRGCARIFLTGGHGITDKGAK